MGALWQDLRFALRQLRRNPAFTVAAALTLALGIAATTTVFSFVDAVLLRPLPYPDPARLFVLWNERPGTERETLSYPNFLDYRTRSGHFESLALYRRRRFNVTDGGAPERLRGAFVTADFFHTLGVAPVTGRSFAEGEDQPGRDQVVMVSERFWRRQLGGDAAAVGRAAIRVEGVPSTVIGVVPDGQGFPSEAEVWVPISREPRWLIESRGLQGYTVLGRLRPGSGLGAAQAQVAAVASALAAEYPTHNAGWTVRLESLQSALAGDTRPTLLLLFGSAAVLLLVAAVNLASMLLARAASRQREIAVRRAVGAGNGRLLRQLMTESVVLAILGGALGVVGALWGVQAWRVFWDNPGGSPAVVRVDWRVLAFALGLSTVTALVFGLVPARRIARGGTAEALRSGAGTGAPKLTGRVLVAGEIALALMLAVGGSLLVRSLLNLQAVDPGFERAGVLTARISLPETSYLEPKRVIEYYRELLGEIERLPGVEAAGAADAVPLIPGGGSFGFQIQGRPTLTPQERPIASWTSATPGFFRALGIRTVAGRAVEEGDDATKPDVVLINETMARTFWPGGDPIGARITFQADQKHWLEVVGVVADVRSEGLDTPVKPHVYVAHAQWGDPALSVVVRTAGDPLHLIAPIQAIARRLDPEIPVAEARTMEDALGASIVPQRLRTAIFGGFATLALLLAAVGIYGVMAYLVVQRRREIALRIALGARGADVVGGMIRHSLALAAPGILVGLGGALAASRALRGFLYEVPPTDPLSLIVVCTAVAVLVVAAALAPARKAACTDPMTTLRSE